MSAMGKRPHTPPPALDTENGQLPTPPPSSGFKKRVRFADEINQHVPKRLTLIRDGDFSTTTELSKEQEYSDESQNPSITSDNFEPYPTWSPLITPHLPTRCDSLTKQVIFADPSLALDASSITKSFPLMKFPLPVRKRIYEYLLTIPALICVRQNHTAYHDERNAYLYAERREFLPGIAYALAQLTVDGYKFRFSRFRSTNAAILRVSKQVHAEAKPVMYGGNDFEIVCPNTEFSPPTDFKTRLFPVGYQRLVRRLNIRIRSFYQLQGLINGQYAQLRDAYRGLEILTIIFELEGAKKGFGKRIYMQEGERWVPYVKRLYNVLVVELFGSSFKVRNIPIWIDLRVLFDGDRYDDIADLDNVCVVDSSGASGAEVGSEQAENALRAALKRGMAEAFELFKKGGY